MRPSTPEDEAEQVAVSIASHIQGGCKPESILVLLKADRHFANSNLIDQALAARGIVAYNPKKDSQSETSAEVQRFIEYLRLSTSLDDNGEPADDLAVRSILELEPGIGSTRIQGIVDWAFENGTRFIAATDYLVSNPSEYEKTGIAKVGERIEQILETALRVASLPNESYEEWLDGLRNLLGAQVGTDEQLDALIGGFDEAYAGEDVTDEVRIQRFMNSIARPADESVTAIEGQVTITTMHGAKGLGADVVYVLQCEDEYLPGGDATSLPDEAEMRRLLYVSITRAKKSLYLSACVSRPGSGKYTGNVQTESRSLSRFLEGAPNLAN